VSRKKGSCAERAVEEGLDALSVCGVAKEVGTTTRAVYSLFRPKDGLITAPAAQAFELLRIGLGALPLSEDPSGGRSQ